MITSSIVVSALKDSRLSNTAIANATGICSLSISHYRRGVRTPNHVNTKKLAAFLGVVDVDAEDLSSLQINHYEEIIRKQNETIDRLMAAIAHLTGTKNNSFDRS
jgi:hemerythrin superfamily protein